MTAVLIRIGLRWLAGALVTYGWLAPDDVGIIADPELVSYLSMGVGMALGAVAEGWYYVARRFGWST